MLKSCSAQKYSTKDCWAPTIINECSTSLIQLNKFAPFAPLRLRANNKLLYYYEVKSKII